MTLLYLPLKMGKAIVCLIETTHDNRGINHCVIGMKYDRWKDYHKQVGDLLVL